MTTQEIVSKALAERAVMLGASTRLAEYEAMLLQLPAGKYEGSEPGERIQVIVPAPGIRPSAQAIEKVREIVGAKDFKKLFTRVVQHKAVKGFREVVNALLTEAKAAKVAQLCEQNGTAYVLWK